MGLNFITGTSEYGSILSKLSGPIREIVFIAFLEGIKFRNQVLLVTSVVHHSQAKQFKLIYRYL